MDASYMIGTIIGSLIAGCIVGLPPFIWARKKGHNTLGVVSILLCVLGNFILGLYLSVPICIIFLIVIAVKKSTTNTTQDTSQTVYQVESQDIDMGETNNNQQTVSTDAQNVFCPYCGVQVENSVVYCTNCGRKVK